MLVGLCVRLCDPMDCSLPGYSTHGIILAKILEWVTIYSSSGSSQPMDQTWVSCDSCIDRFFTTEPPGKLVKIRYIHLIL